MASTIFLRLWRAAAFRPTHAPGGGGGVGGGAWGGGAVRPPPAVTLRPLSCSRLASGFRSTMKSISKLGNRISSSILMANSVWQTARHLIVPAPRLTPCALGKPYDYTPGG